MAAPPLHPVRSTLFFTNLCFRVSNPGDKLVPFDADKMVYLVYQLEKAESGLLHYQGYCELKRNMRLSGVKKLLGFPGAHIELRKGTPDEAADYCKKTEQPGGRVEGTELYEFGEMKVPEPGVRTDINSFKDAALGLNGVDKKRKRELVEDHAVILCKYPRFYNDLKAMYRPTRPVDFEMKVYLLIGPPGCSKTRSVYEAYKGDNKDDLWDSPLNNGTIWFDGYDEHPAALFDDFAGAASHMRLDNFLCLIDRYAKRGPIKGSHCWWLPEVVFITTNIYPRDWWKWEGREIQYQALARRFTAVFDFFEYEENGDPPVGDNHIKPFLAESYITHGISLEGCKCPPRYEGKSWWIREKPESAVPW